MADPALVAQNKKKMKTAPSKTDVYEDNIVRRAREKAKKKGKGRYSKIASLLPSVVNTMHNNTYGPAALQGVNTAQSVPTRTDSGNGWSDKKLDRSRDKVAGYETLVGLDKQALSLPGSNTPTGAGAYRGATYGGLGGLGAGAIAGLLSGALKPGYDEETGERRSRLGQALKRALMYGGVGAGAGMALGGGAGALHGHGFAQGAKGGRYGRYPDIQQELPEAAYKGLDLGIGGLEALGVPQGLL